MVSLIPMNPPSLPMEPDALSRRDFMRLASLSGALVAADPRSLAAEPGAKLKAAVIGHTGRGDYGHGLESIFNNRPNVEVVALADPDSAGRAKTAAKIGAPRSYADYREVLEKERPGLVSIAMRQSDRHQAVAMGALQAGAQMYCGKPFVT